MLSLLLALTLASPAPHRAAVVPSANEQFDSLVARHVRNLARFSPEWSTYSGLHTQDARLDDRSAGAFRRDSIRTAAMRRLLDAIDTTKLDARRKVDWLLLASIYDTQLHDAGRREWQMRAGDYIPFDAVYSLGVSTYGTPQERAAHIISRLEQWPLAMTYGHRQVVPSRAPALWVDLDVRSATGIADYLKTDLPPIIASAHADTARFRRARDTALLALNAYTAWMRDTLKPKATGTWVLGEDEYNWRLKHSKMLDVTVDSLVRLGWNVFHDTENQLNSLAATIDPHKTWRQLSDSAKSLHPSADSVFAAYSHESARARQFLIDKNLVTIPSGEHLEMVVTPPNLRGTYAYGGYSAGAPFEKTQVGRFFVTPVEPGWTPQQVESKLRGDNYGWITVVSGHEGYPGHHLAYVYAAKQPSVLRKIYTSEVEDEGWALYGEQLMYENGFFPDSLARLTQLRMRLWRAGRVIIDPSIHSGRMTFDQAVQLFVDSVGLERNDAIAEVTRYTTWPTQAISYIVGMQAIMDLRSEVRAAEGSQFDLKKFHEALLRQGSLPPVLMRRAVLDELKIPAR